MSRAATSVSQFLFVAVTPTGARKVGVRAAASPSALSRDLSGERLLLLRSWRLPGRASAGSGAFSQKDQMGLNEQLHTLLARGVPLTEALDVAESVVGRGARGRIAKMREQVAAGASFADACERSGGFDTVSVSVYRAAERSGDLADATGRLAAASRRRLAVSGKVGTLLIYPLMVLAIGLIVGGIMLVFVIPQIGEAISAISDPALPWYTRLALGVGNGMKNYWHVLLPLLAAAGAARGIFRKGLSRRAGAVVRTAPLIGRVSLASECARFFAVMGAMTRSGVPVADALGTAARVVSHPRLRGQLLDTQRRLVEGGILSTLIEKVDALPVATRKLLVAADRAGDLDAAFDNLSDDLAKEVDKQSSRLLAVLEPALIVVIFVLVGGLIASIMIPLLTVSRGLR